MQEIERQETVMLASLLGKETLFDFQEVASRDADIEMRTLVCVALKGLVEWANPEWLIPLLSDPDSEVRSHAEHALIPYGDHIPLEPVLQALLKRGTDFEDPLAPAARAALTSML
jgi:hypothetical protein